MGLVRTVLRHYAWWLVLDRHQCQAKSLGDAPDAMVEAEQCESSEGGPRDEHGCHMDGVECPYRLARKRLARAFHDFGSDTEDVPMRSGRGQVCAAIRDFRFRELAKRCRPMEDPVTFNEREVRGQDDLGVDQGPAHQRAGRFVEQPRKYGA